jgi:uncharacterized delta-60 repeat protein/LPXTG-motif cell wall-anchored protein
MRTRRHRIIGATLAVIFSVSPFVGTPQIASAATDGTLDTTFNPDGVGADKAIRAVAFASDGKIYIGGEFTTYRGTAVNALARLNKDGTLDTTFNAGGDGFTKSGAQVLSLHVDTDGDIYVAGNFAKNDANDTGGYNTTALTTNLIRLNSDGSLDTSFTPSPLKYSTLPNDESATVSLVKKIGDVVYISGVFDEVYETGLGNSATSSAQNLLGLTTSGALDANFGAKVKLTDQQGATTKRALQIHAIPNSTDIYVVGNFTYVQTATEESFPILAKYVVRVATDGTRVTTYANKFGEYVGADADVNSSAVTSDGKLILAGDFTTFNGSAAAGLVRVNADGTRDSTFTSPAAVFFSPNLTADSNGRMYITGTGLNYSSSNKNLVRVKADGTLDEDFPLTNTQPNLYAIGVAISPVGEVYVYYYPDASQLSSIGTTKYNGVTVGFIARIAASSPATTAPGSSTTPSAPGQPTDITVKVTGTKAKVSWKAPTTGAAPTSYTASALPTGPRASSVTSARTLSCTATAPSTTCTISGLSAGMRYGFFVQSNGEGGTSTALFTSEQYLVTATTTLPATGSSNTTLLISVFALTLMAGGIGVRRLRRI